MMDKKGIMVKFLLTILLAIIIFAPACLFASKFFRLSGQAKENFHAFVKEVKGFYQDKEKASTSFILVLDKGSFVAFFKERMEADSGEFSFSFPSSFCSQLPCFCLCREVNEEEGILNCDRLLCEETPELNFTEETSNWLLFRGEEENRRIPIFLRKEKGGDLFFILNKN